MNGPSRRIIFNYRHRRHLHFSQRQRRISSSSEQGFQIWNIVDKNYINLTPKRRQFLSWYACGPTVYDSAHIGHASSYIRQDVIRRLVEGIDGRNLGVIQLMGVTDIDDKIIHKANQLHTPWENISRKYELEFFQDLESLNVKLPHVKTRVTDFIPQIILFVGELVNKGYAYRVADGSVYFDTQNYKGYGKLRKIGGENAEILVEEEEGQGKKNKQDFAVWKGSKPDEPFWNCPWGKGRPGWHIECSVMASHYFGSSLDIHSGGVDLIFPHHENEETQCCARFGVQDWVTHWIHTGHLNMKGDVKMSKSLGNTVTIQNFLQDNSAETLRMFCILSKYRHGLEFSQDSIFHAKSLLKKFKDFISDTTAILQSSKVVYLSSRDEGDLWNILIEARQNVFSALTNDFDTPTAIHKISEYIDIFNRCFVVPPSSSFSDVQSSAGIDFGLVLSSKELVRNFISLVGLSNEKKTDENTKSNSSTRVECLLEEINEFRGVVRNYALASDEDNKTIRKQKIVERKSLLEACDQVRTNLSGMGFDVKDHGKSSFVSSS